MNRVRICAIDCYIPKEVLSNTKLAALCNRNKEWFEDLTGIRMRRRAAPGENANTLAICAVERLAANIPFPIAAFDLVIGASYTPWDTVGTIAHRVQREFGIRNAKAFQISSACSSFINALEIAQMFANSGRSERALIVTSEHNSGYTRDDDDQSGHLWGDGAAAVATSVHREDRGTIELIDLETHGLGHLGEGPDAVYLEPIGAGLVMPRGRDVFNHACREMARVAFEVLDRNLLSVADVSILVPHQANKRIIDRVAKSMGIPPSKVAITVDFLGNTGCASIPISYRATSDRLATGDYVLAAAFGGGYSSGAALFRAL